MVAYFRCVYNPCLWVLNRKYTPPTSQTIYCAPASVETYNMNDA